MMVIADRYRVQRELGNGASATVYLAQDTATDSMRAVKVLDMETTQDAAALRHRLHREGRLMASLKHPNILRIFDVMSHGDADYIVMEVAEGGSLGDWLAKNGPMPPRLAVRHILQVLSGLAAAHQLGIIHRDVKPANILLTRGGQAKLCDFGIARTQSHTDRRTRTGVAMGSWAFMAPEQRLDATSVGPEADVYATACTLYNLLTDATPVDLFLAARSSPRWEHIPDPLARIMRRATNARPSDRYPDADTMATSLRTCLDRVGTQPLRTPSTGRRRPVGTTATWTAESTTEREQNSRASIDIPLRTDEMAARDTVYPTPYPHHGPRRSLGWLFTALALVGFTLLGAAATITLLASLGRIAEAPPPPPRSQSPHPVDWTGVWRGAVGSKIVEIELDDFSGLRGSLREEGSGEIARIRGDVARNQHLRLVGWGTSLELEQSEVWGVVTGTWYSSEGATSPVVLTWVGPSMPAGE